MVEKKYIDTKGAAEYLNMSERYVQRLARKGEIPSYRPSGKMLLFNIEELDKWIVSSKANPTNTSMNKPILGIKCHKCGRVYFGHALAYPIDEDSSREIVEAAKRGDDFFVSDGSLTLEGCNCKTE